ncbi:hypothetical protein [Nannocystis radixulma]|uniref:Dickkopf N-terminal cysteine-rich domain-containing protein n=1 Tax=Nannocystis radixulma TaxID=2995305 RepID=A0ABT5BPE6_9BACT|nr:hypothetical protein [Nannocystis radixulma]MDC0675263.1 hypothetical protein [Nannocystis radixulma]
MRRLVIVFAALVCACNGQPALPGASAATEPGVTTGTTEAVVTGPIDVAVLDACPDLVPIPEDEFAARFGAAVCGEKAACGCDLAPGCATHFSALFEAVRRVARGSAPHYDPVCAAAVLHDTLAARGCATRSEYYDDHDGCSRGCQVFRGDVPPGGPCGAFTSIDVAAFADVCAGADMACGVLGTPTCEARSAIPTVARGERCLSADGKTLFACEAGTWCSAESRVCVPEVGFGEKCGRFAECSPAAWCSQDGECLPLKPHGAACQGPRECAALTCERGRCNDFVIACRVDSPADLLFPFTM